MSPEQASRMTPSTSTGGIARPNLRVLPGHAPGPRGLFSGWKLLNDPLPFIDKNFHEYGVIVHTPLACFHVYTVAHPEGIKHVLQDNHRNYRKSADYKLLARILGQGLVTSEGDLWLRQRRLMQPMFHRQKIATF